MSFIVEMQELLLLPWEGCPQALPLLSEHWKGSVAFAFTSPSVLGNGSCFLFWIHLALKINTEKVHVVIDDWVLTVLASLDSLFFPVPSSYFWASASQFPTSSGLF